MKTENTTATKNVLAAAGMKVKANIKAGFNPQPEPPGAHSNHNQTVARGMRVKSGMKGGFNPQPEPPGLRIKSGVKAGGVIIQQ